MVRGGNWQQERSRMSRGPTLAGLVRWKEMDEMRKCAHNILPDLCRVGQDMWMPTGSMCSTRSGVTVRYTLKPPGLADSISAVCPSNWGKKSVSHAHQAGRLWPPILIRRGLV